MKMVELVIILVVLTVLDVLALRFGADSRELDVENRLPAEMHSQI